MDKDVDTGQAKHVDRLYRDLQLCLSFNTITIIIITIAVIINIIVHWFLAISLHGQGCGFQTGQACRQIVQRSRTMSFIAITIIVITTVIMYIIIH